MSIEVVYWVLLITSIISFIVGLAFLCWIKFSYIFDLSEKGNTLIAFTFFVGFFLGCVFTSCLLPSVVEVAKKEYVEADFVVVEYVYQEPTRYQNKFKTLIIHNPETGEYYDVNVTGRFWKVDVEEGKTYRIKYYPSMLKSEFEMFRIIEFLYCIDDINEEAVSTE